MSDQPGSQGRWDHLLREIPSKTKKVPEKKAPSRPITPEPVFEKESEEQENILSVSEINKMIKDQLEGKFHHVWLQGEISNFKAHTSGHHYFSLKDAKSQISAVMFKGYNSRLKFRPESGMEVLVRGKVTVYQPRGNYQIFCEHMEPVGAGALQKAFEQLKTKLASEGLFDEKLKKSIPPFPKKVGIVTSPTGAAIQDILNVLGRRSKRL
ncbi:MAG: exodeoxyribonuclease VII large subunit, partial [Pseudomonadota bacterium]